MIKARDEPEVLPFADNRNKTQNGFSLITINP